MKNPVADILNKLEFPDGNRGVIILIMLGTIFILTGIYISGYKLKPKTEHKFVLKTIDKLIGFVEAFITRTPLSILSKKLECSIEYFMLQDLLQRRIVVIFTFALPAAGTFIFISLNQVLNLWYTKLTALLLCLMVPYYVFTLVVDYMKYYLRMKIPVLIDRFRSSFITCNRIKPALMECSRSIDRTLGRIISRASDCGDLNDSLLRSKESINDIWFNIFVLMLVNYRENGGELIAQLYKLNRTITRYNNIEKKKNKRLIWYEIFTVAVSILSIPAILLLNRMILGINTGIYYDATESFARITIFSICALAVVRILRRI
ncbi:hypothetical protein CLHUN_05780 [Ruminiclostridium hungatei]|uniref:Bacterial type II secretion system protein F domain protein n=1 Tax=Ruminiclostridium hungatei TaxID=48256 RepID=A0A1V4SQT7_RUMHU|nr:type II secretion system protein F [Ruminiclostridium hungatei]OPX45641.1 hypothetical protein CLHUN_05780 [Ruminiclostridium hungatei]